MSPTRAITILFLAACASGASAPVSQAAPRFHGDAANHSNGGEYGPSHDGWVGDGGIRARLTDRTNTNTRYRVCWTRAQGANPTGCKMRTTGPAGRMHVVMMNDPGDVGQYQIRWWVSGQLVAAWKVYWHIGD